MLPTVSLQVKWLSNISKCKCNPSPALPFSQVFTRLKLSRLKLFANLLAKMYKNTKDKQYSKSWQHTLNPPFSLRFLMTISNEQGFCTVHVLQIQVLFFDSWNEHVFCNVFGKNRRTWSKISQTKPEWTAAACCFCFAWACFCVALFVSLCSICSSMFRLGLILGLPPA